MTALPTVDCTVYPYECDAFGHLNEAAFLAVFERARWESLARGPGMDVFRRSGVWPAVRKATIEYRAAAYPGDVLRVETLVTHRGTTSFTLKQVATRVRDTALISEAELVFVCIDSIGRATPIPEEIGRLLGPRTGGAGSRAGGGDLLRVAVGGAELAVEIRGEGPLDVEASARHARALQAHRSRSARRRGLYRPGRRLLDVPVRRRSRSGARRRGRRARRRLRSLDGRVCDVRAAAPAPRAGAGADAVRHQGGGRFATRQARS